MAFKPDNDGAAAGEFRITRMSKRVHIYAAMDVTSYTFLVPPGQNDMTLL